jgi:hypothetical protein
MELVGLSIQKTDTPPRKGMADNLFKPRRDGDTHSNREMYVRKQSLALEAQMRPWAAAAILGAAAAGLVALARRRRAPEPEVETSLSAHQTDGTDSSAQFEAMIADENMVPERLP